jgi:hypothetical protein
MRHFQRFLILITGLTMLTALAAKAGQCDPNIVGEYYNPALNSDVGTKAFVHIIQKDKYITHEPGIEVVTTATINIPCGNKTVPVKYTVNCDSHGNFMNAEYEIDEKNQQCSLGENPRIIFNHDNTLPELGIYEISSLAIITNIKTPGFDGVYHFPKYRHGSPACDQPFCHEGW